MHSMNITGTLLAILTKKLQQNFRDLETSIVGSAVSQAPSNDLFTVVPACRYHAARNSHGSDRGGERRNSARRTRLHDGSRVTEERVRRATTRRSHYASGDARPNGGVRRLRVERASERRASVTARFALLCRVSAAVASSVVVRRANRRDVIRRFAPRRYNNITAIVRYHVVALDGTGLRLRYLTFGEDQCGRDTGIFPRKHDSAAFLRRTNGKRSLGKIAREKSGRR